MFFTLHGEIAIREGNTINGSVLWDVIYGKVKISKFSETSFLSTSKKSALITDEGLLQKQLNAQSSIKLLKYLFIYLFIIYFCHSKHFDFSLGLLWMGTHSLSPLLHWEKSDPYWFSDRQNTSTSVQWLTW